MLPQIIVGSTTHILLTIKIQDLDPTWNHVVDRSALCFPLISSQSILPPRKIFEYGQYRFQEMHPEQDISTNPYYLRISGVVSGGRIPQVRLEF